MRKQQKVWEEEHNTSKSIPSLSEEEPSSAVVEFVEFLKGKGKLKKVIDIGCGKGRNAIYLAKQGFEVYGLDYIQTALDNAKKLAAKNGVTEKVNLFNTPIDQKWPFKDNFFDLAVDCFSSIDIESLKGREVYRDEMYRTLKPDGYALVAVVSINDEWESEIFKKSPGLEKNSVIWPSGKFQKNYDEQELKDFYKDFEIIELKEVKKKAVKLNKEYMATNYWIVLRKK